jgi:hypothetical protein
VKALREPMAEANDNAVSCLTCKIDFHEFRDPQEARHFAIVHNELHAHGQCLGAIAVDVDSDAPDTSAESAGRPSTAEIEATSTAAVAVDEDGW